MTNALNIIFSVFIFVLSKTSYGSTTETAAAENSAPFIVSLQSGGKHYCTGTILSANWVVTAAQCLFSETMNIPYDTLVAGSTSVAGNASTTQKRPINNYVVHPLYTIGRLVSPYDIGLVYTATPFTWSNAVAAISLPSSGTTPSGNAILYGWDRDASRTSGELKVATVPIITLDECESAFPSFIAREDKINTTSFCTGGVGECSAGSGSPLIQRTNNQTVLIGILIAGINSNDCFPIISFLVSSQTSWISANQIERL